MRGSSSRGENGIEDGLGKLMADSARLISPLVND